MRDRGQVCVRIFPDTNLSPLSLDYLNGEDVEQDHVISCENVVPENVEQYPSF